MAAQNQTAKRVPKIEIVLLQQRVDHKIVYRATEDN
jgi:hypothetical protein